MCAQNNLVIAQAPKYFSDLPIWKSFSCSLWTTGHTSIEIQLQALLPPRYTHG